MTTKTKLLLYCGAVFAATTVGVCLLAAFGGNPENRWWISGTALTAGWLFAALAFGSGRWAVTSVPSFSLTVYAFAYLMEQRSLDRQASVLLIVAALASATHLWNVRLRRTSEEQA
jgi:hypothetical protein